MISISVCIGSSCHMKGSYDVVNSLQELIKIKKLEDRVTIKASFCLGQCTKAVSVKVDDGPVISVSKDTIDTFFNDFIVTKL